MVAAVYGEGRQNGGNLGAVLFYVDTAPSAAEMFRVALAFRRQASVAVYFFVTDSFPQLESFSIKCKNSGFKVLTEAECKIQLSKHKRITRISINLGQTHRACMRALSQLKRTAKTQLQTIWRHIRFGFDHWQRMRREDLSQLKRDTKGHLRCVLQHRMTTEHPKNAFSSFVDRTFRALLRRSKIGIKISLHVFSLFTLVNLFVLSLLKLNVHLSWLSASTKRTQALAACRTKKLIRAIGISPTWVKFLLHSKRLKVQQKAHFTRDHLYWLNTYQSRMAFISSLLRKYSIDLLILAKDSVYYETCCWVKASRDLAIPSVLIPFDIADTQAMLEHRAHSTEHRIQNSFEQEILAQHPKWIHPFEGNELILFSAPQIQAVHDLGLSPPNPWGYNSSNCDRILVDNEYHRTKLIREGKAADSVIVTGHIYQDLISQKMGSSDLTKETNKEKLKILISLPPDKLSERKNVRLEFSSYPEMLTYFVKTVCELKAFDVTLCLHPSVKPNEVKFLEVFGARIEFDDTARLIGRCDVYIVDCSATSKWALAAGRLVIDYDMMQYNLEFHSKLDGVVWVKSRQEYAQVLKDLAEGKLEELRKNIQMNAKHGHWGKLDGKASDRIFEESVKLIGFVKQQNHSRSIQ